MRRKAAVGVALVVAGAGLVAWAGSAYARGWLAQDRARSEWEQRLARAEVERGRSRASGPARVESVEGAPVARLVIPKIALDDIVLEGVTPVALNGGPGHLPGSALPGSEGNAVISAHRDRHFGGSASSRLGTPSAHEHSLTASAGGSSRAEWSIVRRR